MARLHARWLTIWQGRDVSESAQILVKPRISGSLVPMNRPRISCNLAISADGKISSANHRPSTWTSESDHQRLKDLRKGADALMVGRGTAETDRMTLTAEGGQPLRCIVSRHGELSIDHPIFHAEGGAIHLLATEGYRGNHGGKATIHEASVTEFLATLHDDLGIELLHCEGGGQLIRELAELDAIDELHLTLAGHSLLGGAESPTLSGMLSEYLKSSKSFEISEFQPQPETGECFLSYRRKDQ